MRNKTIIALWIFFIGTVFTGCDLFKSNEKETPDRSDLIKFELSDSELDSDDSITVTVEGIEEFVAPFITFQAGSDATPYSVDAQVVIKDKKIILKAPVPIVLGYLKNKTEFEINIGDIDTSGEVTQYPSAGTIKITPKADPENVPTKETVFAVFDSVALAFENITPIAETLEPAKSAASIFAQSLDSVLTGDGPFSLKSALDSLEQVDELSYKGLVAVLDNSGFLKSLRALPALMQAIQDPMADTLRGPLVKMSAASPEYVSERWLASQMQSYVLWKLYGDALHESINNVFYATTGLGFVIQKAGKALERFAFPFAVVQACLAWTDFVINKIYVGTFPAKLTEVKIDAFSTYYLPGDTTSLFFKVTAENDPPATGVQDIVGLVLTTLGAGSEASWAKKPENLTALKEWAASVSSAIQGWIGLQNDNHPEYGWDPLTKKMPTWTWTATILDRRYVKLHTDMSEVMIALDSACAWQVDSSLFTTRKPKIWFSTEQYQEELDFGDNIFRKYLGIEYNGGVFGESVIESEKLELEIYGGDLKVEVAFPKMFDYAQYQQLQAAKEQFPDLKDPYELKVTAWYHKREKQGEIDTTRYWAEGHRVKIIVDAAGEDITEGELDSAGEFKFSPKIAEGIDSIYIEAIVFDSSGGEVSRKHVAVNMANFDFMLSQRGFGFFGPGFQKNGGGYCLEESNSEIYENCTEILSNQIQTVHPTGSATAPTTSPLLYAYSHVNYAGTRETEDMMKGWWRSNKLQWPLGSERDATANQKMYWSKDRLRFITWAEYDTTGTPMMTVLGTSMVIFPGESGVDLTIKLRLEEKNEVEHNSVKELLGENIILRTWSASEEMVDYSEMQKEDGYWVWRKNVKLNKDLNQYDFTVDLVFLHLPSGVPDVFRSKGIPGSSDVYPYTGSVRKIYCEFILEGEGTLRGGLSEFGGGELHNIERIY